MRWGFFFLMFLFVLSGCSEQWQTLPQEPYLGQRVPKDVAEIFAPGVISRPESFEFAGVFSPDMLSFYFTRRDSGRRDQHVWFIEWNHNRWSRPAPASFAADAMSYEPLFHPDGAFLYFGSQRPFAGKPANERLTFFWKTQRTTGGWSEPERLAGVVGEALPSYLSIARDSTLYFGSYSRPGIQSARWTQEGYETPFTVSGPFDSLQGVGHPFIAPDQSYMIVDAQNGPGHQGYMDLYVTFQTARGEWSPAVNLGPGVNSPASEMAGSVTPDGRYLIFTHADYEGGDLWWVDAGVIEAVKKEKNEK